MVLHRMSTVAWVFSFLFFLSYIIHTVTDGYRGVVMSLSVSEEMPRTPRVGVKGPREAHVIAFSPSSPSSPRRCRQASWGCDQSAPAPRGPSFVFSESHKESTYTFGNITLKPPSFPIPTGITCQGLIKTGLVPVPEPHYTIYLLSSSPMRPHPNFKKSVFVFSEKYFVLNKKVKSDQVQTLDWVFEKVKGFYELSILS